MDKAAESNKILLDAWDVFAVGSETAASKRGSLIEIAWCGLPSLFFNLTLNTSRPQNLQEFSDAVSETVAWATPRGLPWMMGLCQETLGPMLDDAGKLLEDAGFFHLMKMTGMEADEIQPWTRERPAADWRTEADPDIAVPIIQVNEAAYHVDIAPPGSLPMHQPGWWTAPDRMVTLAADGDQGLSSAAVLNLNGLRYAALVATHPEAQRKGYATATLSDVLDRSLAAGLSSRSYLHATEAGRPVYERLGYRPTAEYAIYAKVG